MMTEPHAVHAASEAGSPPSGAPDRHDVAVDPKRFFDLGTARFCMLRPDGYILWASRNWHRPDLVGSRVWERVHPADAPTLRAALRSAVDGVEEDLFPIRWLGCGETWRWLQVRAAPSRDGRSVYCSMVDITDDVARRRSLARQNELLPVAEDVGRFGHWRYDVADGSVAWSDGIYRIYGVDPDSFTPTYEKAVAAFHPDDREHVETAVRRAVATRSRFSFERRLVRPDGSEVIVHCIGLCEAGDGGTIALSGILQDITAAREVEADLRQARRSLVSANRLISQIMAGAQKYIVAVDDKVRITACNESYRAMFHRVVGRSIDVGDCIPEALEDFPEQRATIESNYRRALAGERFIHIAEYPSANGIPSITENHYGPVRNAEGRVIGACAVIHDVSEQRDTERRLEASEKRFRELITGSLQGVLIHRDFVPLFANESYARIFGFDSLDDVREVPSLLALLPEEERDAYLARHRALLDGTGGSYKGRFKQYRRNGEVVWVDFIASRVDWKGSPAGQTLFLDVTERVRYAEQLEAERARFREEAITDGLTGAFNRRHFLATAERELQRVQRHADPSAIVTFDLDDFKAVNDTFGHDVGDTVLREITRAARSALRDIDMLGRLGGEEFAVILPETAMDAAVAVAERLRETFAAIRFDGGGTGFSVTASFGVAVSTKGTATVDMLLRQADDALYRAKAAGRNRVLRAED